MYNALVFRICLKWFWVKLYNKSIRISADKDGDMLRWLIVSGIFMLSNSTGMSSQMLDL